MNQERSKQIYERQTRKLQDIVKDAEVDEQLLDNLENERNRLAELEIRKKNEKLQSKYVLQQQMMEKEKLKEESRAEYMRDKGLVDDIVKRIMQEDLDALNENQRKKEVARSYMNQAYEDKEQRKIQQKEDERLAKERERQYYEELARRERDLSMKKAAIQEEKDKIFEKLSVEQERRQAEKDYWENVRNELYVEEMKRNEKIKELQEQEKKQR